MLCSDSIKPEDEATVSELLSKLELEDLNLISSLVWACGASEQLVQSEQHVIYRLMADRGQGGPS